MKWMLRLAVLLSLTGCGPKSSSTELTMWLVGSEAQAKTINRLGEQFATQHGFTVRCEAVAWGEAHSKYLTAVAGGVQPDIGTMGLTWGSEFGRLGALVNLRQEFPQEVAAVQQATFQGLWGSIEENQEVYGIPFDLTLQVLFHRTDLITQAPKTWGELTSLLTKLGQQERRMIIDWGNLSWIGYAPFLWQAGGDFYNADQTASALGSPESVKALEYFSELYTKYGVPRTSVPVEQGLRTGEFPLAMTGNWKTVSLTSGVPEIAGKWTIAPLTQGPSGRRTAFLGGRIVGVFANSEHKAEAWKFVRHLYDPAVQAELYQDAMQTQDAYLPSNLAAWDRIQMDTPMRQVLLAQAQEAMGPPSVPGWNESTHAIEAAIQRVILHGGDPKQQLDLAATEMNKQLRAAKTHR